MSNPSNSDATHKSSYQSDEDRSAIKAVIAGRNIKYYQLTETEIKGLSFADDVASICFGLGTTFLGIAVGIYCSFCNYDPKEMKPTSLVLYDDGRICSVALVVICTVLWLGARRNKKTVFDIIKSEEIKDRFPA